MTYSLYCILLSFLYIACGQSARMLIRPGNGMDCHHACSSSVLNWIYRIAEDHEQDDIDLTSSNSMHAHI